MRLVLYFHFLFCMLTLFLLSHPDYSFTLIYLLLTSKPGALGLILVLLLQKLHYWLMGRGTSVLHRAAHSAHHRIFHTPQLNVSGVPNNSGNKKLFSEISKSPY